MVKTTRKSALSLIVLILIISFVGGSTLTAKAATNIFINEIHYDNTGGDTGEAVEIAGPAGTDLTGWTLALYNGSATQLNVYDTISLSGTIPNQQNGYGTLSFNTPGIQNGSPDGLALVDSSNIVIQFLSYEGSFTAASGPAAGMTSTDIGVSEPGTDPVGQSLQLTGTGSLDSDFTWTAPSADSFGAINTGQTFSITALVFINEIQVSTTGTDWEFFELQGTPGTDLSSLTLIGIESDIESTTGTIDRVISLAGETIPADGFWLGINSTGATTYSVTGDMSIPENAFENSTATYFLVSDFTGAAGDDLDTSDDGNLDNTPWTDILDSLNIRDANAADFDYGAVQVGPDGSFLPSGTYRCPDAPTGTFDSNFLNFSTPDGTPGTANACTATNIIINEVDADTPTLPTNDAAEFIELYDGGTGNTSLTGLTVVLFNGSGDTSYQAIDLDGYSTDANGYFVIGSTGVNGVSIVLPVNTIQNGADAVALYVDDAANFPNGTAVTTTNLRDALVYDTSDGDDPGLLVLLNASEPQVNENGNGNGANESNQRCPNGIGGQRNTSSYEQWEPTPGTANLCMAIATNIVINEVDADNVGTDTTEFIELYDGGTGNTALDGLVLVTFNGSDDQSYNLGGYSNAIDLDGYSTDANGYFILGNSAIASADITFGNDSLQNGADAVALFIGDGSDFPNDTPVSTTNLLDALVYDTSDTDDAGLLVLLNPTEPQVNENGNGNGAAESSQRCPNGAGGQRNTSGFTQMAPSPDADNPCMAIDLELSKVANQTLVFEGDTISFTLTVSNTSTNQDATNVIVRDYLPDPTTQVENIAVTNCPQGTTSYPSAGTLEWSVGTVAQGTSFSCDVQMGVRTGTNGSTFTNTAEVYLCE